MSQVPTFFSELMAIARRELVRIRGDRKLRSLMLLAPLINVAIVCGVYAPSYVTEVPLAVVDQNGSAMSQRIIRWLDFHQKLQVLERVADVASAERLLNQRKIAGYVVLEKDFSQRLKRNEEARILLYCDATHMVLANTLNAAVQGIVQTFNAGVGLQKARRLGAFKGQAQSLISPIRAEVRPIGNPSFSYADFMLPGMLLSVLQQVILLGLALSWAGERESGSWAELPSHTQRPWVIILGKNMPHFLLHFFWLVLSTGIILPMSHVSSQADWGSLLIFAALFIGVLVSWGTWVSLVIGDRLGATQALMFLAVPSFLLSGYTWPSASLPLVLQMLSQILPLTHSAVMFRQMHGMGVGISAFPKEISILLLLIGLHLLLAFLSVRRSMGRTGNS